MSIVSAFARPRGALLAAVLSSLVIFVARAQLIFDENFNYPCCISISGTGGWGPFSGGGISPVQTTSVGLVYAGYQSSGQGVAIQLNNVAGEDVQHPANANIGTGSIYAGMLISVSSTSTGGNLLFNFFGNGSTNAQTTGLTIRQGGGGYQLGLVSGGTSYSTTVLNFGQTYLIGIQYNATSRLYSLYINPALNANLPAPDITRTHSGTAHSIINGVVAYQEFGNGVVTLDGIRVSQSWSDIVGALPGGAALVTESFNYSSGLTSNGWQPIPGMSATSISSGGAGLNYGKLGSAGNSAILSDLGTTIGNYFPISPVSSGSVYYRFLINPTNSFTTGTTAHIGFYSSGASNNFNQDQGFIIRNFSPAIKYGGSPGSYSTAGFSILNPGSTYVFVLQYNVDTDEYTLYQNPAVGSTVPNGNFNVQFAGSLPTGSIDGVTLIQDGNLSALVDEIKVSTSWAEVMAIGEPFPASTFITNSVTQTSIGFTFSPPGTGADGYVVFRGTMAPPVAAPVDNTLYVAGQTVGDAVVVSIGSSTNIIDNTVIAGTTYYYSIYPYYTDFATVYNYRQSTPLQGIVSTETCCQPTGLTINNVGSNQMDLSFLPATPPVSGYLVVRNVNSFGATLPVDGVNYAAGDPIGSAVVAYSGVAMAFTDTGLTPATDYYYQVYSFSGSGSAINYNTTLPPLQGNMKTLAAEPTTQAANVSFTNMGPSGYTVSWTPGNGGNYLVVAHQNAPVDALPQDALLYSANSNFGAGAQLGTGNYVVYNGGATSVNVTGLSPSVVYHFSVFTYNATLNGTQNYLTSPGIGNPSSRTTTAVLPTIPNSGFTVTSSTPSQQTLTWTNGNGTTRIVVARLGSAVNSDPAQGTGYTASTTFGSGSQIGSNNFVVYSGTETTVTVTGLTAASAYFYQVYESNGVGAASSYLTIPAVTTSQFTLANPPTLATTALTISSTTDVQQTLTWTNGNGTNRVILAKANSAVSSNPLNGTGYTANSIFGLSTQVGTGNYVVYSGSGSTVTVTGLSPSTTYYYQVFEFNGSNATSNYLIAPIVTANQVTLASQPATQATALVVSSVTDVQQTLAWTIGSGTNRIVLARAGSAVNANPVDGVGLAASSIFGSGAQVGTGNFVVYSGTGNGVTVTGLAPGTSYFYQVYEFNGSGTTANYLTTPAVTASQFTWASEPTLQSSGLAISGSTDTQQTLTWTGGNGANRIILAKASSAVNSAPIDATGYTASATFGTGTQLGTGNYVVYSGSGTTVTVSGLAASTTYHYQVFEFNGSGLTSNYLTLPATIANQTTLASPPVVQATSIVFSGTTNSQQVLNWSNGNGARRVVLARSGAAVNSNPANATGYTANSIFGSGAQVGSGNYVVYDGTGSTVTVTGLASSTVYHYQVFEYNGAAGTQNYLTTIATGNPANQTTLAGPPSIQASSLAFSSTTHNALTLSWTPGNGSKRIVLAKASTPIASLPVNGTSYSANSIFGSGTQIAVGTFVLYDGAGTSVSVTGLSSATTYYFQVFEYNGGGATATYLTTTATNNPGNTITLANPATVQATTVGFSAVAHNQLSLNWTSGNGSSRVVLMKAGSVVNATPLSATSYTANAAFGSGAQIGTGNYVVYNGIGNTVTVTALSPSTTYHVQVFEYNGAATTINYLTTTASGNPASQTTLASPVLTQASAIVFSSVQSGQVNLSWTNGSGARRLVLAHQGATVDASPVNASAYVANPAFGTGGQLGIGNFVVYDGTGSSTTVTNLLANTTYHVQVFEYNGSGLDNNFNTGTATGNPSSKLTLTLPPNANAPSGIDQTLFTANWAAVTGATGGYFIDVSADGFSSMVTGFNNLAVAGTSVNVTGLTPGTNYQYRVRAANASGPSANSSIIAVLTLPATPAANQGSPVSTTSFTANWSPVTSAIDYTVDVATDNGFTSMVSGFSGVVVTGTSLAVTGLSAGATYYYRVKARNGTGFSPPSPTITQLTVPSVPQNVRSSSPTSTGFIIQWDPVFGAASYELDVMDQNLVFVPGYQAKSVVTAFAQVTGLLPSTLYVVQVRAVNVGGTSVSSVQQPVTTSDAGGAGGGTIVAPQINLAATSTVNGLKANITANTGINNVIVFYHRKITEASFTKGSPVPGNTLEVVYNPTNDLDDLGMEYYFKAIDQVNRADSTALSYVYTTTSGADVKTAANLASGGTLESYRIFAIPLKLANDNIDEVFSPVIIKYGGYDKTKWRLVHWKSGQNVDYKQGLQRIELGKGYWYNSVDDVVISVTGTAAEANQANGGFSLALDAGYTQIGNPYTFDINWNDVLTKNGDPAGVGSLFVYDAANASFKQADVLPAWQGGFVKSGSPITVKIPVNVSRVGGRSAGRQELSADLGGDAWLLPLRLEQGSAYNEMGGIGMHPMASMENDRYDEHTLPRFIRYLELNSWHENYFLHRFTRDVVPTVPQYNWTFTVESNFDKGPVTISWDAKSLGTNDAQLILYDEASNVLVDMKRNSQYTLMVNTKATLRFIYGSDGTHLLPPITGLGRPYPNPFTQTVSIPLIAAQGSSMVQVAVYDITGRQVRTLVQGDITPGMHEVLWDGTDDQGNRLSPGLYIYRLVGQGVTAQQGRIIMR